jgi:hypothetical protein
MLITVQPNKRQRSDLRRSAALQITVQPNMPMDPVRKPTTYLRARSEPLFSCHAQNGKFPTNIGLYKLVRVFGADIKKHTPFSIPAPHFLQSRLRASIIRRAVHPGSPSPVVQLQCCYPLGTMAARLVQVARLGAHSSHRVKDTRNGEGREQ